MLSTNIVILRIKKRWSFRTKIRICPGLACFDYFVYKLFHFVQLFIFKSSDLISIIRLHHLLFWLFFVITIIICNLITFQLWLSCCTRFLIYMSNIYVLILVIILLFRCKSFCLVILVIALIVKLWCFLLPMLKLIF